MKNQILENKVIWVTGSSRGIGLEIAKILSKNNTKVAICGRSNFDENDLNKHFNQENINNNIVKYYKCNFENSDEIIDTYQKICSDFGKIDILVNNAGVGLFKSFKDIELEDFDITMNINFRSVFITTKLVLKDFIENNKGMILNILSVATEKTFKHASIYAASKSAIKSMMNSLREETRKYNIDIINIYPGATSTEIWDQKQLDEYKYRMMEANEIAELTQDVILNCLNNNVMIEDIIVRPKLGDL